jgi:phosphopantothenoylcysteine decarboxylase/phosphopantothenate--cysteine ligase
VGFAAETERVLEHAREKLERKRLDLIVANDVGRGDIGFDSEYNEVHVLSAHDVQAVPHGTKDAVARAIVTVIANHVRAAGKPECT